MVIEGFFFYSR